MDAPVEISAEAYQLLCDERMRESFKHLVEKLPPTRQQKAFKRLQQRCQQIQSALWSGRIAWLGLATGDEIVRINELYAWDQQTILASSPGGEATSVRYFFVPAESTAFRSRIAQPEPFMLRVLADPRMAMVLL